MKTKMFFFLAIIPAVLEVNGQSQAQVCGTDVAHNYLMLTDSVYKKQLIDLESKIKSNIQNQDNNRLQTQIYTIPVVVHVIHLGEAVGSGTNISDSQILGAIQGMNNRYANITGNSSNMQMQFCLASRDPNGNVTTGINRMNGSGITDYSTLGIAIGGCGIGASEENVKALSRWPVSSYYNIWVVREICNGQYGGWAYYPFGGVNDGTVIISSLMTSASTILSHELGHGFYLYHTFEGDGGNVSCPINTSCIDNGDKVCDTPPHKQSDCSATIPCSGSGIWHNTRYNYMSYCGSLDRFTQGQKDRARAVAVVSPRLSLLTSLGCTPVTANDAGIEEVVYPIKTTYTSNCTFPNTINPIIKLKNYGASSLLSVTINYKLDSNPIESYSWNGNLSSGSFLNVTLPSISISTGSHTILAFTTNPNGNSDGYILNDSGDVALNYIISQPFYLTENSVSNATCYGNSDGSANVATVNKTEIIENWEGTTDWNLVNGSQVNRWHIGPASANGGANSIYVSDNSSANAYTINSSSVVHFYKDFYFPAGATNITIKFDWKGQGQSGADYLRVYLIPTTTIPAAGNQLTSGQIGNTYVFQNTYSTVTIIGLDGNAGTTKRLVFSWRNDAATGAQPPASIDNITIHYNTSGNNPYNYSWNTFPVQTTSTANNLPSGSYLVTVTDASSCTSSLSFTITQPSPVSVSVNPSGATTFCQGDSVILSASTSNFYMWNNNSTTQNITVSTTGNYSVSVTDGNGCSATSSSVSVTVNSCVGHLNISAFINGYYLGNGLLRAVADPVNHPTLCDTIRVELHNMAYPYNVAFVVTSTIDINGNGLFIFPPGVQGNSYYIVVRHRNAVETWSKFPVMFNSSTVNYDFTR